MQRLSRNVAVFAIVTFVLSGLPYSVASADETRPPALLGYELFGSVQLTIACQDGAVTSVETVMHWDASHTGIPYTFRVEASIDSPPDQVPGPSATDDLALPGGGTGTYRHRFALTSDGTGVNRLTVQVRQLDSDYVFVSRSVPLACNTNYFPPTTVPHWSVGALTCSGAVEVTVNGAPLQDPYSWLLFLPGGGQVAGGPVEPGQTSKFKIRGLSRSAVGQFIEMSFRGTARGDTSVVDAGERQIRASIRVGQGACGA